MCAARLASGACWPLGPAVLYSMNTLSPWASTRPMVTTRAKGRTADSSRRPSKRGCGNRSISMGMQGFEPRISLTRRRPCWCDGSKPRGSDGNEVLMPQLPRTTSCWSRSRPNHCWSRNLHRSLFPLHHHPETFRLLKTPREGFIPHLLKRRDKNLLKNILNIPFTQIYPQYPQQLIKLV